MKSKELAIPVFVLLTLLFLVVSYKLSFELAQLISMVIAGSVMGLLFTVISWPAIHSHLSYFEQTNFLVPQFIILSVSIFWLAATFGEGSMFKIHFIDDLSFANLVFLGGFFGVMTAGAGLMIDQTLLSKNKASRLMFLFDLFATLFFFLGIPVWYLASKGLLTIISFLIARIVFSILLNHIFIEEIENRLTALSIFTLGLTFVFLPITAFILR